MSRPVRCYACGRRASPAAPACPACGTPFRALCECEAELGLYDAACGACGAPHQPRSYPWRRLAVVRITAACALLLGIVLWAAWAVRRDPDELWRVREAAVRAWDDGAYEEALTRFGEIVRRAPGDRDALFNLALCVERTGAAPEECRRVAERLLAVAPDSADAHLLLARIALRSGATDLALSEVSAALELDDSAAAHRLAARLILHREDSSAREALDHLRTARVLGERAPELQVEIAGAILRLYGPWTARLATVEHRAELEPALSALAARPTDRPDRWADRLLAAHLLLALDRPELAAVEAQAALDGLGAEGSDVAAAESLLLLGASAFRHGNPEMGRDEFTRALRRDRSLTTTTRLVHWAAALGAEENAGRVLLRAAGEDDPEGAIATAVAMLRLQAGDPEGAAEALDGAPASGSQSGATVYVRSRVLSELGRVSEAAADLRRSIELAPDLLAARLGLLEAATSGEPGFDLVAALEAHVAAHPADARALRRLAAARLAAGDAPGAIQSVLQAVGENPTSSAAWILLARCHLTGGGAGAARSAAAALERARATQVDHHGLVAAEIRLRLADDDAVRAGFLCDEALRTHVDDVALLRLRVRSNRRLGRWSACATDLRKLLELGDPLESTLVGLVQAEYRAGRRDRALLLAREHESMASPLLAAMLGAFVARETEGIDAAIERAREVGPTRALALLQLAAGRAGDAADTLRRVLAARPGDGPASLLLTAFLLDDPDVSPSSLTEVRGLLEAMRPGAGGDGHAEAVAGRLALAEGDAATAVDHLRRAVALTAEPTLPQLLLGEALLAAGRVEEGIETLRLAAASPTAPPGVGRLVADRLLAAVAGQDEEILREALRFDPASMEAASRLADLQMTRGDVAGAGAVVARTLATTGRSEPRLHGLAALTDLLLGKEEAAIGHLAGAGPWSERDGVVRDIALLRRSADPGAAARLRETGGPSRRAAALELARKAAEDGDLAAVAALARREADESGPGRFWLLLCDLLTDSGGAERALDAARHASAAAPEEAAPPVAAARALRALDRPADAGNVLEAFAQRAPRPLAAAVRLLLDESRLRDGERPELVLSSVRGVLRGGDLAPAAIAWGHTIEAEALLAQGRPDEAAAIAEPLVSRTGDPRPPVPPATARMEHRLRIVLAAAALEHRRFGEAAAEFRRCLAIRPGDPLLMNNLAWALARTDGGVSEAYALAIAATEASPETAASWDTRADCARRLGRSEDAEQSWRLALGRFEAEGQRSVGDRARAILEFAEFLRQSERGAEARELVEIVPSLVPESVEARRARVFLEER